MWDWTNGLHGKTEKADCNRSEKKNADTARKSELLTSTTAFVASLDQPTTPESSLPAPRSRELAWPGIQFKRAEDKDHAGEQEGIKDPYQHLTTYKNWQVNMWEDAASEITTGYQPTPIFRACWPLALTTKHIF